MANIDELMGTDIAHVGDFKKTATGDLDVLTGIANIRQALYHRLLTEPGTIIHRPTFGVGLKQFQNAPGSLAVQRQLALKIKEQFEQDPRVKKVEGVRLVAEDASPFLTVLIIRVQLVGYGEAELKYTPFSEGV